MVSCPPGIRIASSRIPRGVGCRNSTHTPHRTPRERVRVLSVGDIPPWDVGFNWWGGFQFRIGKGSLSELVTMREVNLRGKRAGPWILPFAYGSDLPGEGGVRARGASRSSFVLSLASAVFAGSDMFKRRILEMGFFETLQETPRSQ